jgi:DNA-binding Xre family transcriptional regulator
MAKVKKKDGREGIPQRLIDEYKNSTKLKKMMIDRDLKQEKLATMVVIFPATKSTPARTIAKSSLNQIVNDGKDYMVKRTLYALCRALKCSPNDILDWEKHCPEVAKRYAGN